MAIARTRIKYIYSLNAEGCEDTLYFDSTYDVVLYLQSEEAFLPVTIDRIEVCSFEEVGDEPTNP